MNKFIHIYTHIVYIYIYVCVYMYVYTHTGVRPSIWTIKNRERKNEHLIHNHLSYQELSYIKSENKLIKHKSKSAWSRSGERIQKIRTKH